MRILILFRLYPNIYLSPHPGKVYEVKRLLSRTKFTGREAVLDFGCGSGLLTFIIGTKCNSVTGLDINEAGIQNARRKAELLRGRINVKFHCGPIEDADLKEESFDKVFSFCVIEHVSNYEEVLRILYRILKPGGELMFSVDTLASITDPIIIEKHRQTCMIEQYFKEDALRALLETTGFCDIEIHPLLVSEYAKRQWTDRVTSGNFGYWFPRTFLGYLKMKYCEAQAKSAQAGLFLEIKCRKPSHLPSGRGKPNCD